MGDPEKRPQASNQDGHRKKHHPSAHWRHYEVSGQFNACMSDPENEERDCNNAERKQHSNDNNGNDGDQEKICLDGDLKGDAHVNSKGLIVGQAEVHSNHNAIDVNFEMQANRKHKHKHKDENSKGRRDSSSPSDHYPSDQGPNGPHGGPGGPHAPKDPSTDQTSSESDDGAGKPKPKYSASAGAGRTAQLPTPALTGTDSGLSREGSGVGEASGDSGESSSMTTSGDASADSNGSSSNSVNGNSNTPDENNSADSKEESPLIGAETKRETPSGNESNNLVSTQVNQAPYIQKLYAMLEDTKLEHIIRWAPTFDRFYINPNEEFSQTLCHYFKHTNISSFVRQLSMYGFHKVSNSSHQRDKYYPWEFRHMDGLFKRGDLESLRSIKRRSTRQMNSKRINYMAVVNGNDAKVKHEPSPSYIPGPLPTASPVAQVLPHYPPDPQRASTSYPSTGTAHQSPMSQHMIYPEMNGNGNTSGNGSALAHTNHQFNMSNGMANGNGHVLNGSGNRNGHMAPSSNESAVRLMRMHQAVQSQLVMVQETMTRLSQNMNEMGVVIDQIVSQQTIPQGQIPSAPSEGSRMPDNEFLQSGAANGKHQPPQPQQLAHPQYPQPQPQHQQPPPPPPPPPPYNQDDAQSRFQLRTLLN